MAAARGHPDMVELLVTHGADVNTQTRAGNTPLHKTASHGQPAAAERLIALGADINAVAKQGTPLQLTMTLCQSSDQTRCQRVAELLRQHGATE